MTSMGAMGRSGLQGKTREDEPPTIHKWPRGRVRLRICTYDAHLTSGRRGCIARVDEPANSRTLPASTLCVAVSLTGLTRMPSARARRWTSVPLVMHSDPTHVSPRPTGPVSSSALMAWSSASFPLRCESWLPPSLKRSLKEDQKLSLLGAMRVA